MRPVLQKMAQREVILWLDTFNNYLHPETARAAFEVLQKAGFHVRVPQRHFCCGRPLYDFGLARRSEIVSDEAFSIRWRRPLMRACPSWCSSRAARRFSGTNSATCFRKRRAPSACGIKHFCSANSSNARASNFPLPKLARKVLLHGHCHHKSLMKMKDEESVLRKMGADLQSLDSGCCGMAGPFGFEQEKYAVSQAIGERVLLPAVRQSQR